MQQYIHPIWLAKEIENHHLSLLYFTTVALWYFNQPKNSPLVLVITKSSTCAKPSQNAKLV
jgi:hypothetical protein